MFDRYNSQTRGSQTAVLVSKWERWILGLVRMSLNYSAPNLTKWRAADQYHLCKLDVHHVQTKFSNLSWFSIKNFTQYFHPKFFFNSDYFCGKFHFMANSFKRSFPGSWVVKVCQMPRGGGVLPMHMKGQRGSAHFIPLPPVRLCIYPFFIIGFVEQYICFTSAKHHKIRNGNIGLRLP